MKKILKRICLPAVLFIFLATPLFSQEDTESGTENDFGFGLDIEIGAETFNEFDADGNPVAISYQTLSLNPDVSFGKFGIGLALTLHYRFLAPQENNDSNIAIREEDWIPSGDTSFMELYLPKFRYIRYGLKGEDLYVKLGSIDDGTLGNGFIMGNYANTLFLPDERVFGMSFDLDGRLFNFPYLGIETFAGNLAHFDVIGVRVFGRPLIWLDVPIIKNLELGTTIAGDVDPDYRSEYFDLDLFGASFKAESVTIWGIDVIQPILSNPAVSLAAFGDFVVEPDGASGGMLGLGGRFFGIIPYAVQLRFLGDNFIPVYFDASYDLSRGEKYYIIKGAGTVDGSVGWLASTGFSLLDDQLAFHASIDGPFSPVPENRVDSTFMEYPHIRMILLVKEGLLPGFFFNADYDKKYIDSWASLISPADAVIGFNINYKTGPAVITLGYDLRYNPNYDPDDPESKRWETTAKLSSSISLF